MWRHLQCWCIRGDSDYAASEMDIQFDHVPGVMDSGVTSGGGTLTDSLRLAASKGQLDQVQDYLQAGATFDPDQDGRTALHYAALNGYVDVTRFLVERGCNINFQDHSGYTALHRAASQGHMEVISTLLESGCEVNTQDEHGNAALHEAAWNGFSRTLELLVKHNVDVGVVNKAGFTALHLSAQNGHNESSRVLLYAGCNSDHKNNYGDTALHTAARYGHAGVTRILISARAKLNEANKNGDTALHIAAALKRRKIAKLLVDSGMDVNIKNKQNETAADVARRKEHGEIISIIQTFGRKTPRPLKEVNFKDEIHEIDGPVVVPDRDLPEKQDCKPEKSRKFFFFKKKKSKEKEKAGVTSQKSVPGCSIHVHGNTPVQGFFSKYVPRQGVQYYRDLAGNVKQGPVGYTPTCNCMPALHRLEQQVHNERENVYGHIQTTHQAMQERLEQVDHRSSLRIHALEKFTRERFSEEENLCRQRVDDRFHDYESHYVPQNDQMRGQIQNWLEQKLEGYGHCLHHHHDDSALPNENIFSEIHETANGRLFKSRSDETLSQSDNHSGKFRKREFYESRQAAMQQIRAWQVPAYSKDRNRVRVAEKQVRNTPSGSRNQRQQINSQPDLSRPRYPVEPHVEIRTQGRMDETGHDKSLPQPYYKQFHAKHEEDQTYMTMSSYQTQGAVPKNTNLPQPQSYQPGRDTVSRNNGPVTHSTPKSRDSSPYETHGNTVRDNHDRAAGRNSADSGCVDHLSDQEQGSPTKMSSAYNTGTGVSTPRSSSRHLNFGSLNKESSFGSSPQSSPQKRFSGGADQMPGVRNSTSSGSERFMPEMPKPTFTTFGYDDSTDGHMAPVNSPEQVADPSKRSYTDIPSASTPRTIKASDQLSKNIYDSFGRQTSQGSSGFVPSNQESVYMDMNHTKSEMHTRTRSSELLNDSNLDRTGGFSRSQSAERTLDSHMSQSPMTPRSSSETRGGLLTSMSNTWAYQKLPPSSQQTSYPRNTSHPQYSSTPYGPQTSFNRPVSGPPVAPKPSPQARKSFDPYMSVGNVQRNSDPKFNGTPYSAQQRNTDSNTSDSPYSTVQEVKSNSRPAVLSDINANTKPSIYYSQSPMGGVKNSGSRENLLEPRNQTAYQTYLTGDSNYPPESVYPRDNSPNICNNSKEDSSSNPDSGYSSKIYGNRLSSITPASCSSTPSSSFSTDRGISIPSNNNSPQSQYSNGDYEGLPKQQYHDEVQNHVQTWYQRKLQETTQRVYDNWRKEKSPGKPIQNGGQRLPVVNYGSGDYAKVQYSGPALTGRSSQGQPQYGYNGQSTGHMVPTYQVHGSDV